MSAMHDTCIRKWNCEVFGNIMGRKERLRRRLGGVQSRLADQPSPGLLEFERKLKEWWDEVLTQEETMWHQKSRIQ